jgi:hypothetical protein
MGGQNCHVDVVFDDLVTWTVRIRLDDPTLPPQPVQNYIFQSEVATLKFLATTSVPAPLVYGYQVESPENSVGASYILMQKMAGKPLDWNKASKEQRNRVMDQLANVFLELERHPFKMTGSMVLGDTLGKLGGFAQTPLFATPESPLGPFTTLDAAYSAAITQQLQTIANGEVTSLTVDNYLAFRWRLSALPALLSSSDANEGPFYLKHFDDKGDHILVDENFDITGIIDWEFASAEAKNLAFSSPCMMWPVRQYCDGSNNLSDEEIQFAHIFNQRGRKDLGDLILNGRRWQRFLFFLGGGVSTDKAKFQSLFQGLLESFGTDDNQQLPWSYENWRQKAIAMYSEQDPILEHLLRQERT